MKKPIILILPAFILSSCKFDEAKISKGRVGLNRYENEEVVCFSGYYENSLWCYKKTLEIVPCEVKKGGAK